MELKSGYKLTEVGVIPEDWKMRRLGDSVAIMNGFAFSSEFFSAKGPILLTPGNFRLDGGLYFNKDNTKRYSGLFPDKFRLKPNDLVVVMTDLTPDCNLLGKPAFVDIHHDLLHNQRIGKITFANRAATPRFLYWYFLSGPYLTRMKETATGSTVRHTSPSTILDCLIVLPPTKAEQDVIAEALSDADALIDSLEQLITKKSHLKQGAMQELLTGKRRLPGFEGEWEINKLGDMASFRTGPFGSALHKSDYSNDGVPIINPMHIVGGEIIPERSMTITEDAAEKLSEFRVKPGEIVIGRRGDMGRCAVVREENRGWLCGTGSMIVRPFLSTCPHFLQRVLSSPQIISAIEEVSVGSTMINLNQGILMGLRVQAPPLAEQTAIAAVLSDMDTEVTALETKLAKARQIKQGMMQELLTGRIRLVNGSTGQNANGGCHAG
ncbi:MAG: restriction endonuclease subunit S [Rhodospirillaceae bacterium]